MEVKHMIEKKQCKLLKEMRAKIAKDNGIDGFEYKDCPYEGPCSGTCPACDAEAEALYYALKNNGKSVDPKDIGYSKDRINQFVSELNNKPLVMGMPVLPDDNYIDPKNTAINADRLLGEMKYVDPNESKNSNEDVVIMQGKIMPPSPLSHKTRGKISKSAWEKEQRKTDNSSKKPRGLIGLFKKKKDEE
jgi:hypothetical protein